MFVGYILCHSMDNDGLYICLPGGVREKFREGSGWKFWRRTSSKWIWRRASSKSILFTVWVMHVSAPYQNTRCPLNCIEGVSMGSLEALQGNKYKKNMWLLMAGCNWVGFSIWSNLWFLHSLSNGVASLGPKVCWCRELMSEDAGRPFKSMLHEEQKCNTVFESAMGQ